MLLVTSLERKKSVQIRPLPHAKHVPYHYEVSVLRQLLYTECRFIPAPFTPDISVYNCLRVLLADVYAGFEEKEM